MWVGGWPAYREMRKCAMRYELFYWPSIQGRGELVRLALEAAGAVYVDVARESGRDLGVEAMMRLMDGPALQRPPFAPPFVDIHDTHHPIAMSLYYEDQKPEAKRRAKFFTEERAPELLGYFENVLQRNPGRRGYMVGRTLSYVDLSMFQIVDGLRYAFPRMMARLEPGIPGLVALHDRVAQRPNVAAYLTSERRLPFNMDGIFRHYPELET
jgi:glutathione S-transferase